MQHKILKTIAFCAALSSGASMAGPQSIATITPSVLALGTTTHTAFSQSLSLGSGVPALGSSGGDDSLADMISKNSDFPDVFAKPSSFTIRVIRALDLN